VTNRSTTLALLLAVLWTGGRAAASPADGLPPNDTPPILRELDVHEHLGQQLPLDLAFRDQTGRSITLRQALRAGRPTVLTLVYFDCPMLCSLVMNGLAHTLSELSGWKLGQQYDAVTLSFDPNDTLEKATDRRRAMLDKVGAADQPAVWPFLTGDAQSIAAVAQAVGFDFRYDRDAKTFAHNAVIFVLTGDGRVSRYLYGVSFDPFQLRLALTEAGQGKAGTSFERFLLTCYHYDPATRRYGSQIVAYYRFGGALILGALVAFLARLFWRERHPSPKPSTTSVSS
jgi:protein SCO1/2